MAVYGDNPSGEGVALSLMKFSTRFFNALLDNIAFVIIVVILVSAVIVPGVVVFYFTNSIFWAVLTFCVVGVIVISLLDAWK